MKSRVETYRDLARRLDEYRKSGVNEELENELLDEMDDLWFSMRDDEIDELESGVPRGS